MPRDPTRAALALLCVAVVLFGGSLFPTAGFGSYPTGAGGNGDAAGPGGLPTPTDGDGLTSTPAEPTATATATDSQQTATATPTPAPTQTETETPAPADTPTVGGSLTDALVALVGFLVAVGAGLAAFAFAPGIDPETTVAGLPVGRFRTNLRGFFGAVPRRTTAFVVGLSASVPGVLDRTLNVAADATSAFGVVFGSLARGAGKTLAALGSGLGTAAFALPSALGGLASFLGGFRRLGSGGVSRRHRRDDSEADADAAAPAPDPEAEPDPVPRTVEEAWTMMAERVPVGNRRSATPGEYARAAVAAGFPESAVRRLTDAFERVRYGGQSGREQLPTARDALARIRAFWNGGEEA